MEKKAFYQKRFPKESFSNDFKHADSERKSDRICFEGDIRSATSSGRIMRELLLAARGIELPIAINTRKSYLHFEDFPISPFLEKILARPATGRIRAFCLPSFALPKSLERGNYWAISSFDPVNPMKSEVEKLSYADLIFVPSEIHARVCLKYGIKPEKIRIFPPSVNHRIFHQRSSLPEVRRPEFRFLIVANPLFRKGVDLALKAFIEEFKSVEPVRLILKLTHMPKLKKGFPYEISDLAKRLGALNKMFPPVTVISEIMEDRKLAGLMAGCHAFLSPGRSYRTGLTVLEAMSCALPVIGPETLSSISPFGEEVGFIVPVHSAIARADSLFPGSSECRVQEIDIKIMRQKMRESFLHPGISRRKGLEGSRRIKAMKNWKTVATILTREIVRVESQN